MRLPRLAAAVVFAATLAATAAPAPDRRPDFGDEVASPAARFAVQSILYGHDHEGRPFAVVDKPGAKLYVFDANGRLVGASPALLGQAIGDDTVPGVGAKAPSEVLPHERTTPAGRFVSEPGRNLQGDNVVWVDYDSGFAIHRVRAGASYAPRLQRLASAAPLAHRASLGCVVVDSGFYDRVVWPVLGQGKAVVYVLPETRPVASLFAVPPMGQVAAAEAAANR